MPEADSPDTQPLPDVVTNEEREYREWADSLSVSVEALREAVEAVGHSADAVRDHLNARKA